MSKNKVPHVSFANPTFFPMIENAWHGNPARRISKLGISFVFILVISPEGYSPKFAKYVLHASLSRMSATELSSHLGVHRFVAEKAITQSKRFKPKQLKTVCDKLGSFDGAIKSGELLVDTALWNSVLKIHFGD